MMVCVAEYAGFYELSPDLLEVAVAHIQLIIVTKWVLPRMKEIWSMASFIFYWHLFISVCYGTYNG